MCVLNLLVCMCMYVHKYMFVFMYVLLSLLVLGGIEMIIALNVLYEYIIISIYTIEGEL